MLGHLHKTCRDSTKPYMKTEVFRVAVPDEKVSWDIKWDDYKPVEFNSDKIKGKEWADPEDVKGIKFNQVDGKLNRKSHMGDYKLDESGAPLNPEGRTGLRGRGILGRWGPNHAVDPLVSRFNNGKLQYIAIERSDTRQWALPGGMVDAGEEPIGAAKREFTEEALDNVSVKEMEELWKKGAVLYKGYVDDHRNTDNSWMETVVFNFHDSDGVMEKASLKAGDDAKNVKWANVDDDIPLYASHSHFIKLLAKHHKYNQ
uniref:Nudix hydrolase domain-containing protein n=1 Tax=Panagrolaimus sp. ES5 TaxID=591445 RepID=A0AC34G405_9BILA